MIFKFITGIAIVVACSQAAIFIAPFFLFGELCVAVQEARRTRRASA